MKLVSYDNNGETFDRYTVVDLDRPADNLGDLYDAIGASDTPFSPNGFGQLTTAMLGSHLGTRVAFKKLPVDVQKLTLQYFGE